MGQHLTMTPQLQQAIRLLQLSTLDLQLEIQEALDSNPMLEVEDSFDAPAAPSNEFEESDYVRTQEIAATGDSNSDDFSESYSGEITYSESSGDTFGDEGFSATSFNEGEGFSESEGFGDTDNYSGTDDYSESATE